MLKAQEGAGARGRVQVASRAISAAGLLAWSWGVQPSRAALPEPQAAAAEQAALAWLQHCLLGLSTSKAEEVQFTGGRGGGGRGAPAELQ